MSYSHLKKEEKVKKKENTIKKGQNVQTSSWHKKMKSIYL